MWHYPAPSFYWHSVLVGDRYDVHAEDPVGVKVCKYREKYLGYIVMRPRAPLNGPPPNLPIYMITPDGVIWTIMDAPDIAQDKSGTIDVGIINGTGITYIVHSSIAPVVDHFSQNKEKWRKHGKLTRDGNKIRLTLAETGKTLIKNLRVWQPMDQHKPHGKTYLKPGINC